MMSSLIASYIDMAKTSATEGVEVRDCHVGGKSLLRSDKVPWKETLVNGSLMSFCALVGSHHQGLTRMGLSDHSGQLVISDAPRGRFKRSWVDARQLVGGDLL